MKTESAVLRRLGPVPFWRGERKCLDVLGEIYSRAMDSARGKLGDAASAPPPDPGAARRRPEARPEARTE